MLQAFEKAKILKNKLKQNIFKDVLQPKFEMKHDNFINCTQISRQF